MTEEIFDVVDADDRVIGRAPRSEVHARGLLHRAVNIFVFDSTGRLLLQKRSATKDQYPGCWTSSASGHLDAGEDYDSAAARELEEELGLSLPVERLGKFAAGPEMAHEHTVLYRLVSDAPVNPAANEIETLAWRDPLQVVEEMAAEPERFTPPFRVLLRWYVERYA